jgi:hypothetical protein
MAGHSSTTLFRETMESRRPQCGTQTEMRQFRRMRAGQGCVVTEARSDSTLAAFRTEFASPCGAEERRVVEACPLPSYFFARV